MSNKPIVRVRDVMKSDFDMVDGMSTVAEALVNFKHIECKCFIVNRRHKDDEYGIVLLADIAKKVLAKDKSPERMNVYEIMTKPIFSVDPDMDIRYCSRLFEKLGQSRVPVVKDRQIIGIVGYTDIVLLGVRDRLMGAKE